MAKRKTDTDGVKREKWNSYMTELQHHLPRIANWELQGLSTEQKLDALLKYHAAVQQERNTRWFIALTIINILVLVATAVITFCK